MNPLDTIQIELLDGTMMFIDITDTEDIGASLRRYDEMIQEREPIGVCTNLSGNDEWLVVIPPQLVKRMAVKMDEAI